MFGEYIKQLRAEKRLGLREFCLSAECDPSNWSKVERGVLTPPQEKEKLLKIAAALGVDEHSDAWNKIVDNAAIAAGKIPEYVLKDEEVLRQLPVFFRTVTGKKPTREELIKLAEILKQP